MKHLIPALALSLLPLGAAALPVTRCVNLGDALDSPSVEGEWTYVIEQRDIAMVAQAGFDTIRLPVRFSTRWDGERIDPAFLARVDAVIGMALDAGLNVILDLHHFEDLMTDPDKLSPAFTAIWAALGDHYAGWPDGLIFELLNEPIEAMTTARVVPLYQAIIADLRPAHPERWIILEGSDAASLAQMQHLPDFGPFTAHSFHYYDPFEFTHQKLWYDDPPLPARGWTAATERAAIIRDFATVPVDGPPILLGEFGTYRDIDPASRTNWLKAVRHASEDRGIGWCVWSFASNFSIVTDDKSGWLPGILPALGLESAQTAP